MAADSRKNVISAWMILRLALRNAAGRYAPRLMERASAFGAEPADPQKLEELVRRLGAELGKEASERQASPVLRFLRSVIAPTDADRERRNLFKSFESYARSWRNWQAGGK